MEPSIAISRHRGRRRGRRRGNACRRPSRPKGGVVAKRPRRQKEAEARAAAEVAILAEAQRKQAEAAARQQAMKTEQDAARGLPPSMSGQVARPANGISNRAYHPGPADYPQAQSYATPASQAAAPAPEHQFNGREDHYLQVRNAWAPAETREPAAPPAWLSAGDRSDSPAQAVVPPAPEDTLQASRDRLTSRWFALNGLFSGATAAAETVPAAAAQRAPVLAVFSLAGGVGKTSLVATLGRALSARGERVLLVDTGGLRTSPVLLWRARPAARRAADIYGSQHQRRCAGADDHRGSGIARSRRRYAGEPYAGDFAAVAGSRAGDRGPGHRFRRRHASGAADVAHGSGTRGARHEFGGKR